MTRASTSERRGGWAPALADHRGEPRAEADSVDDPLGVVHVSAPEAVLVERQLERGGALAGAARYLARCCQLAFDLVRDLVGSAG